MSRGSYQRQSNQPSLHEKDMGVEHHITNDTVFNDMSQIGHENHLCYPQRNIFYVMRYITDNISEKFCAAFTH